MRSSSRDGLSLPDMGVILPFLAGVLALFALLCGNFAHAATFTDAGHGTCTAGAPTCTVNVDATVASGSTIILVGVLHTSDNGYTPTASDNATTSNCSGAYSSAVKSSSLNGTIAVLYCASTSGAMTSGTTCGGGGTTQCSFTLTCGSGCATNYYELVYAFTVTGLNTSGTLFDSAGTNATGTWTSGSATSFATSPALRYTSETALAIISAGSGAAADTMGSYTGGYSSVASLTSTTSRPEMFISQQTLTSGTATLGATPSSSAGRNYNSIVVTFVNSGASSLSGCYRTLLGVGC